MPRQARKRAESGIYHVMLRGIDRQAIFEDRQDYFSFLQIVQECRELCGFQLFAYCLMGNHVHMLIKVVHDPLKTIFKRIAGRYVYWYNVKYQRVGHLFQDRFKSEPVEDDAYFLTVLRYIHQNPVKANLCKRPGDYSFSSYADYLSDSTAVDTEFALRILPREELIRFNNEPNNDQCLELQPQRRLAVTDEQARAIIAKYAHCQTVTEFQHLDEKKKIRCVKQIHESGVSIRQLCRLTGITKGLIEKWLKDEKNEN